MSGFLNRMLSIVITVLAGAPFAFAAPTPILFVGNSYTFGRVDPVMSYNAANVHDLTAAMNVANSGGSNPYEPHPWGGVPGIFKQFTVEAGLDYDVSISARNAASLRGHLLNTNPAGWDLLGNIASQKWGAVVLQDLSDEPLPLLKGANANLGIFNFYTNKLEDYIHTGIKPGQDLATDVLNTTEGQLWGGPATGSAAVRAALCIAGTGGPANPNALSQTACNTARTIKGNPNESTSTNVYLYQTWARPDMIYPHTNTVTDPVTGAILPGSGAATLYEPTLQAMTQDLHNAYFGLAASNSDFKGVAPVGDAFLLAVQSGKATGNPYAPDALTDGLIDLWWDDNLHASKYGSYLSALTMFGTITGLDPQGIGMYDIAARDLGISQRDAYTLQQIAAAQLGFALVPEPMSLMLVSLGLLGLAASRRVTRQ
jgi:hypothetical protein